MKLSRRLGIILAAGAVLAAVVVVAVTALSAPRAPLASTVEDATHAVAAGPSTSTPPSTEPYWLIKQRQAKATTPTTPGPSPDEPAPQGTSVAADAGGAASVPIVTTNVVLTGGRTALAGVWSGTAGVLARYLLTENPRPSFSVPVETLADLYVRYAADAGLRADILWAQMLHETGFGRYGGDVHVHQNNFAGIGATGGGEPGCTFATAEAGVKAHIAHMVAYVFAVSPVSWANAETDPRFQAVNPRGSATVLADLDGRWAVPGVGYGARIEQHVAAINRVNP